MCPRPRDSRRRGVMLVITLLSLVLLAVLVFYVLNLGQQVNNRVNAQHAADAAAKAGSAWFARSLNTVAANNVGIARYLAAIDVIDAMPQAIEYANKETHSLHESLSNQLARGVGTDPGQLDAIVVDNYQQLLATLDANIQQMDPVEDVFESMDVADLTFHNRGGAFWRGIYAMDELSQALLQNLGVMAQSAAISGGQTNLPEGDSDTFLLPLEPTLPYQRGPFSDFERPVRQGLLPDAVDDKTFNRGPYDALFGWRVIQYEVTGGTWVPGSRTVTSSGRANNPLSRGEGSNGRMVGGTSTPRSYSVYGPYEWMLNRVADYNRDHLENTRFYSYLRRIADLKLNHLFPGGSVHELYDPDWRIDYEEAKSIADVGDPPIRETAFFIVEIKSKYPRGDPNFLAPGTWSLAFDEANDFTNPRVAYVRGWVDPEEWGITRLNPYVWRDEWTYQVSSDPAIGIVPQQITNPDGSVTLDESAQTVYRIDHIAFGGVNVGPPTEVRDPFEGFPRDVGPMDLDHNLLPHDSPVDRRNYLSVLGVSRRSDQPHVWPTGFRGGRPYPNLVAVAQAKVFNNHSWDLWTQMWHGELEPVSDFALWAQAMNTGGAGGGSISLINAAELAELQRYFSAATPLAEIMLGH